MNQLQDPLIPQVRPLQSKTCYTQIDYEDRSGQAKQVLLTCYILSHVIDDHAMVD